MALPYGSPHGTSCVHGPHDVDPAAADAVHFVVQIGDDAGVIRDDADAFADVRRAPAEAQIDVPMFLTQGGEDGIRILDNHTMAGDSLSKTLAADLGQGVAGHGLIVEYPDAVLAALREEHGHVDLSLCRRGPNIGER